jgi:hypothetical protein
LSTAAAARVAHQGFSTIPFDDDSAVADHVERTLPELVTAYAALRQEAVETLATSEDAWRPVAAELSKWVTERRGSGSAPDAPAS